MHPASPPTDFPILNPSTTAGKRAAKLHQVWVDQYGRANQVEVDYVAAQTAKRDTEAALRDVLAKRELDKATDADAKAAEEAHADAKAEANAPWQERAKAAVDAAETRRAEYEAFIDDNLDDLVIELDPDAQAAVTTIRQAAQTMADGIAAWREARNRAATLIGPAQLINNQAIPLLTGSVEAASNAANRLLADGDGLALPVPSRRHLDQRRIDLGLPVMRNYVWKGQDGAPV